MTGQKLIIVVGATGAQGGSVAKAFLADPAWKVRAITRDASSPKAQALQLKGAELVEANLNDVISLEKAFEGAQAIFGVTDFNTLYRDPSLKSKLKAGQLMSQLCFELETQQGRNIFDAAAKIPSLERLIYSTLANSSKLSNGKHPRIFHLDAKAYPAEHAEKTYPELWSRTSRIMLGTYLSNYLLHPWSKPSKNAETGTYELRSIYPEFLGPTVAAEEDTGVLVKALVAAAPGKNLAAIRDMMSANQLATLMSETLGINVSAVKGSFDQAPAELKQELEETYDWAAEFGMFGEKVDKSVITPKELDSSLQLGTVEDWIKAQDWSGVFSA